MAVRSRIPQGRSSKLGTTSKLPHSTNRYKVTSRLPNHKLAQSASSNHSEVTLNSDCSTDNYKLAFVKSSDLGQATDVNANNNSLNSNLSKIAVNTKSPLQNSSIDEKSIGNSALVTDDNCDIISICSSDVSPAKVFKDIPLIKGCQDINGHLTNPLQINQITVIQDQLSIDNKLRTDSSHQFNVDTTTHLFGGSAESGSSSSCSSLADNSCGSNSLTVNKSKVKYLKRSRFSAKQSLGSKTKSLPTTSTSTFIGEYKSRIGDTNPQNQIASKQNKIQLPRKVTASNAMEYVKRITSRSASSDEKQLTTDSTTRLCNGKINGTSSYSRLGRKVSMTDQALRKKRNDGKWSNDINAAMNINRTFTHCNNEEVVSTGRAERKKLHQQSKVAQRNNKNFEEYLHEESSPNLPALNGVNLNGIPQSTELRKSGSRTPKIARPVTRPPRCRALPTDDDDDDANESGRKENKSICDTTNMNQEKEAFQQQPSPSRRMSAPLTDDTAATNSRQRRRASDTRSLDQIPAAASTSETNGTHPPTLLESGDCQASDMARRKDRLQQNERYQDILENPDIITFGQWRLRHEGNYAPEEKYGVSERRRIRSSIDSDSISPVRSPLKLSASEDLTDDLVLCRVPGSEDRPNGRDEDILDDPYSDHKDSSFRNPDYSEGECDMFDDLPSLNSTALMVDYSTCSNTSVFNIEEHNDISRDHTGQPEDVANTTFCNEDDADVSERNHTDDVDEDHLPHPTNEVKSDVNSASFTSCLRLPHVMDEVVTECKVMKREITRLHIFLNEEEEEKTRTESEMKKLRDKNDLLTKEVNRLTRILEMKQSSPLKQAAARHQLGNSDASCQTDDNTGVRYKTEIRSVELDVEQAVLQLNQVKKAKDEFDVTVTEAEAKLASLLKGIQQM